MAVTKKSIVSSSSMSAKDTKARAGSMSTAKVAEQATALREVVGKVTAGNVVAGRSIVPAKAHSIVPAKAHSIVPAKAHSIVPAKAHSIVPAKAHSIVPA